MANKYAKKLEQRQINPNTGEVWNIADVPSIWLAKVEAKIDADGFVIDSDGTVIPRPVNED